MPDWCFTVTVNAGHKKAMNVLTGSSQDAVKSRRTQGSPLKKSLKGAHGKCPFKKYLGGGETCVCPDFTVTCEEPDMLF